VLLPRRADIMILYLLEYTEQANEKVEAIQEQSHEDQADKSDLTITDIIPGLPFASADIGDVRDRSRDLTVPRDARGRCASNDGCKEIIKA